MFCKTKNIILAAVLCLSGSQITQAETQLDYGSILNSGGTLSGGSFSLETASPYAQTLAQSVNFHLVPTFVTSICGNDLREGNEKCDGVDLNGMTCANYGFNSGTLGCDSFCEFQTTGCYTASADGGSGFRDYCSNFVIDAFKGEECDDGNKVDGDGCSALCQIEEAVVVPDEDVSEIEVGESGEEEGGAVLPDEDQTVPVYLADEPTGPTSEVIVQTYHPANQVTHEEQMAEALHNSANLIKTNDDTPVLNGVLEAGETYEVLVRQGDKLVEVSALSFKTDKFGNFLYEIPEGMAEGDYLVQVYRAGERVNSVLDFAFEVTGEVYSDLEVLALAGHESLISRPNELQKLGSIYLVDNPVLRGVAFPGAKVVVYLENQNVQVFQVVANEEGAFSLALPTHSGATKLTILQVYPDGTISKNLTYLYENLNTCVTQEGSTLTFVLLIILSLLLGAYLHRVLSEQKNKKKHV